MLSAASFYTIPFKDYDAAPIKVGIPFVQNLASLQIQWADVVGSYILRLVFLLR